MPSGIEHIDLTEDERKLLHTIVFCEVSSFLDGSRINGEDIGRDPFPLLGIWAVTEEYRVRFDYLGDLVNVLDIIGWLPQVGTGQTRLFLYPPVVRGLRFCKATVDRESESADIFRAHDVEVSETQGEEKSLMDNLVKVAEGG